MRIETGRYEIKAKVGEGYEKIYTPFAYTYNINQLPGAIKSIEKRFPKYKGKIVVFKEILEEVPLGSLLNLFLREQNRKKL